MRELRVFRICGLAVLGGIAIIGGDLWFNGTDTLPELRTVNVEHRDLRITIATTGTIEPEQIVEVSPEVHGWIESFGRDPEDPGEPIGVGARVANGTVLFQIARQDYEIAVQNARLAYQALQVEVARLETLMQQADRNLERAERLRATNTQSQYDSVLTSHKLAMSQLESGRIRLEQSAASLREAEIRLGKSTVRSPIDGVVIDRRANLGQHVHAGQAGLFLLATSLDQMRIRASVSESDIGKVQVGQPVTFSVDANRDKTLTGRVEKILLNARVQGSFVTYDVLVAIDRTETTLFPHMTASVEFETVKHDNAWLVPNAATHWQPSGEQIEPGHSPPDAGQSCVWIPSGNGRVRPIAVRTGIDDGVLTEVEGDGFQDGMPVVVGVIKKTKLARIVPSAKVMR